GASGAARLHNRRFFGRLRGGRAGYDVCGHEGLRSWGQEAAAKIIARIEPRLDRFGLAVRALLEGKDRSGSWMALVIGYRQDGGDQVRLIGVKDANHVAVSRRDLQQVKDICAWSQDGPGNLDGLRESKRCGFIPLIGAGNGGL